MKAGRRWLVTICLVVIGYFGWLAVNQGYLELHLEYEHLYAASIRIMDRVERLDGYEEGKTPVCLMVVNPNPESEISQSERGGRFFRRLVDDSSMSPTHFPCLRNQYFLHRSSFLFPWMIHYYLGIPQVPDVDRVVGETAEKLKDSPELEAMPFFPAEGSVRMIDGAAVVKVRPHAF